MLVGFDTEKEKVGKGFWFNSELEVQHTPKIFQPSSPGGSLLFAARTQTPCNRLEIYLWRSGNFDLVALLELKCPGKSNNSALATKCRLAQHLQLLRLAPEGLLVR